MRKNRRDGQSVNSRKKKTLARDLQEVRAVVVVAEEVINAQTIETATTRANIKKSLVKMTKTRREVAAVIAVESTSTMVTSVNTMKMNSTP